MALSMAALARRVGLGALGHLSALQENRERTKYWPALFDRIEGRLLANVIAAGGKLTPTRWSASRAC